MGILDPSPWSGADVTGETFEKELPRTRGSPVLARRSLAHWFAGDVDSNEVRTAELLVSELVTNAVMHGHGKIILRAHLDQDRLLVEVIDEGGGFERTVRHGDFDSIGGRGLAIVDAEASRWGIHEGTTHVWFELERPGPRLGPDKNPVD
jgi:anti-sigma regulatory factor (Ser/Thr protein kinase)